MITWLAEKAYKSYSNDWNNFNGIKCKEDVNFTTRLSSVDDLTMDATAMGILVMWKAFIEARSKGINQVSDIYRVNKGVPGSFRRFVALR
jgi:hypothetical protein